MTDLKQYNWLLEEPAPRHLLEALKLYGTTEVVGSAHNPVILDWAKECQIPGYNADEIPWCGLFMAVVMKRAGREFPKTPLWARAWAEFGVAPLFPAQLGDVLVFSRSGGGGHVGIYVGEDKTSYHVLGGNQGNMVNVVRILRTRLITHRRPAYNNAPENIRQIELSAFGRVSENEA